MFPRFIRSLLPVACLLPAMADFPEPYDTEKKAARPPMTAAEAAASFQLPPGFTATVFAAEPDVRQPVAMAFDFRGRLWVVENYTYAESGVNFATNLLDRVLVLEDRDGDGRAEHRKVFWDRGHIVTSVEPVPGGVFVLSPPRLLHFADRDGDDVPDGDPEVVLDGLETTTGNRHTFANGLKTGPDGWLWGRVGISSGARVGPPGTPEADRVELRGGIWRYHPERRVIEAVSHGTTNPWGLDWNAEGEAFFINTVIGHLWHAIPGAHYERMHGNDVLPRAYALMTQAADHLHFDAGAGWMKSRPAADGAAAPASDALGGGHAHAALLIYQGTNWPASYRDGLFTWNLHGRRANRERLERRGSGYVGRHEPDLLQSGDPWIRGIELLQGPEGAVYLADWSDTGECHEHDGVHRGSGRIYRIAHGSPPKPSIPAFLDLPSRHLATLATDPNEWTSRMAIRALRVRGADPDVAAGLRDHLAAGDGDTRQRLRRLWALQAVGGTDEALLLGLSRDPDEHLRSWAVRLLLDSHPVDHEEIPVLGRADAVPAPAVVARLVEMGRTDPSGLVRLHLASSLQRLALPPRMALARELVRRSEDAGDTNLGRLIWYGISPVAASDPTALRSLGEAGVLPEIRRFVTRRLGELWLDGDPGLAPLLASMSTAPGAALRDVLAGLADAFRGIRRTTRPATWDPFAAAVARSGDAAAAARLREVEVVFGDGRAMEELQALAQDRDADVLARRSAIRALVEARATGTGALLRRLVDDGSLRVPALTGLLGLGEPGAVDVVMARVPWLGLEERPAVVGALVTRVDGAAGLLDALENGRIRRADLTAFHAAQMLRLGDPGIRERLARLWGTVRTGSAERRAEIARWRAALDAPTLAAARPGRGRLVFNETCAGCHRLYGEGGDVGPDLTGSGRFDLGYLLENVVDPGAVVAAEQRLTVARLKDGRTLSGLLREPDDRGFVLVGPGTREVVARSEIESMETLDQSAMPDGLLEALSPGQVRDLIAYLMHPRQVPVEAGE